ncbi:MAG: hypothetical protein JW934_24720 [Anaerolineae bacterium]|nr:hypothetical protein [Anaerolineae bacterium]
MKPPQVPDQPLVRLHKNIQVPNIHDVEFTHLPVLQRYHEVECHIVLYPYSRRVSSENLAFYPFEEYVKDVLSQQRSAYARQQDRFNEVFGLSLGLLIALIFWAFKPEELLSIESIVSMFGAYVIGKELWDDIERVLVEISKNWPLRYRDSYYQYALEKHTTLTAYSLLAKQKRYGKTMPLPARIDFIKQSNSQTVRMLFDMRDFKHFDAHKHIEAQDAHILSIHIDPAVHDAFEQEGYLFGVKLSLNRRFFGITRHLELFQSSGQGELGCLDEQGVWNPRAVFYRQTFSIGRIKYFMRQGLAADRAIIDCTGAICRAET